MKRNLEKRQNTQIIPFYVINGYIVLENFSFLPKIHFSTLRDTL